MKFNPNLHSVIVAFNRPTMKEDKEIIRTFYDGPIVELEGCWMDDKEHSYQLDCNSKFNFWKLDQELYRCNQQAYIILKPCGYTMLAKPMYRIHQGIGRMTQVPNKEESCTYCPSTKTYWKAL